MVNEEKLNTLPVKKKCRQNKNTMTWPRVKFRHTPHPTPTKNKKKCARFLFSFFFVLCAITWNHHFHMHSSTATTSHSASTSNPSKRQRMEKSESSVSCSQDTVQELFASAASSPCSTTCVEPQQSPSNSALASTSELPLGEASNHIPIHPGASCVPEEKPNSTSPENATESSSGILKIMHTTDKHPCLFATWFERRSGWGKDKQMFMVRLRDNEGWVVVPFEDMITYSCCFDEDSRWLVYYNPENYPPFAAYTGIIIPNAHVHIRGKQRVELDWSAYTKMVTNIYKSFSC